MGGETSPVVVSVRAPARRAQERFVVVQVEDARALRPRVVRGRHRDAHVRAGGRGDPRAEAVVGADDDAAPDVDGVRTRRAPEAAGPVGVLAEEAQAAAHEELRGVVRGVHDARGDAREASEEGRMEKLDLSRRLVASRRVVVLDD